MKKVELIYGITCPYCRVANKMLSRIIEENPGKIVLKKTLVSTPKGMIRRYKLGIHAVPAILIDEKIVFRYLPEEEELKKELKLI